MTRGQLIELVRRQALGGQPNDDTDFTDGLLNQWVNMGIALAAQKNYNDNVRLEGIGYINNGFYATYKSLSISPYEDNVWSIELPEIPVGIGKNEGISDIKIKGTEGEISLPLIPISQNQVTYFQTMRHIPNKTLYSYEGNTILIYSTLILNPYKANVTMVSGGSSTDMSAQVNIPSDYLSVITDFVFLMAQKQLNVVPDRANDGSDIK